MKTYAQVLDDLAADLAERQRQILVHRRKAILRRTRAFDLVNGSNTCDHQSLAGWRWAHGREKT
jgi:hypothetical protein